MQVPVYGKGRYHMMIIDDEDYEKIKDKTLSITTCANGVYVKTSKMTNYKLERKLVHRIVMGEPVGFEIDHINHNPLDNRKENLRIVTHRENMRHAQARKGKQGRTSQYKGVCFYKGKWIAQCRMKDGRNKSIGKFLDEKEAAKAFNQFAAEHYGTEYEVFNIIE